MRAVVQRVSSAVCRVGERTTGEIERGLCVLLGIGAGDGEAELRFAALPPTRLQTCASFRTRRGS